jgi:hypothetical protein
MRQKRAQKPDPETAGAEARRKREKATETAVHVTLNQGNCVMYPVVMIDGNWVPLSTVLALPIAIGVNSK